MRMLSLEGDRGVFNFILPISWVHIRIMRGSNLKTTHKNWYMKWQWHGQVIGKTLQSPFYEAWIHSWHKTLQKVEAVDVAKHPGVCFCNLTELLSPNSTPALRMNVGQFRISLPFLDSVYIIHLTTAALVGGGGGVRREVVIEVTIQCFQVEFYFQPIILYLMNWFLHLPKDQNSLTYSKHSSFMCLMNERINEWITK